MRPLLVIAALVLSAVGCSGSDGSDVSETAADAPPTEAVPDEVTGSAPPSAEPPSTETAGSETADTRVVASEPPSSEAVEAAPADALLEDSFAVVEELAADELDGRNNLTDGSAAARRVLLDRLVGVVEPAQPGGPGDAGYLQQYDAGTNIVGILPGSGALADEYVLIGAHYDHLGECDARGVVDDDVCNGAADNAAGVAAVISIVNTVTYAGIQQPSGDAESVERRSIIVALWDGEEDGLVGSQVYVDDPLVPLDQTVAYVNFDIQGAQLSPALADATVLVGPETGGAVLVDAARRATEASPLDYSTFSIVFGQGRSDHANLAAAGVPSVFFTDANNGCYHTVLDDIAHVDRDKFYRQVATAQILVDDLLTMPTPPAFVVDAPLTTYEDAVELLDLVARAEPDFGRLPGDGPATSAQFLVDLQTIAGAGPDAYDDAAAGVVLAGAAILVNALAESECTLPV